MKRMTIFRTVTVLLAALLGMGLCACNSTSDSIDPFSSTVASTKPETTLASTVETTAPITDGEHPDILTPEEARIAYLKSVTYLDYELTGEDEPYFFGRWFEQKRGTKTHTVSVTSGSTIYFLIEEATSFDVNFTEVTQHETPYFAYSIDGAEPIRQSILNPTVPLPDKYHHTVRIIADGLNEHENKWMREEGFALKSIVPSEGGSIYGIRPTNKVIFFYGDSITEGICALPGTLSTADSNSATNSYPWHCCEALGAVPYMIAYGGTGIVASGSFNTMDKAISFYSEGREVDDGVIPDIIVINHGTNDKRLSADVFEPALQDTLDRLRAKYPDTPIVYVIPIHQAQAASIRKIMADVENGYVVESADWSMTYTDTVHPDAKGAAVMGEALARELETLFGKNFFD